MDDYLMHVGRSKRNGAKIGSGRYPLGSGERPYQGDPEKIAFSAERVLSNTNRAREAAKNIERKTRSRKKRPDLSKMSDDELRNKVNRKRLEEDYIRLIDNPDAQVSKGRKKVIDILDVAGDVVTLSGTAVMLGAEIYKTIRSIKG